MLKLSQYDPEMDRCDLSLSDPDISMNTLHDDRFVIVPVDKAANNYAVICKKYYISVLKKELGIANLNLNSNSLFKFQFFVW
jgi:hypothetical protein